MHHHCRVIIVGSWFLNSLNDQQAGEVMTILMRVEPKTTAPKEMSPERMLRVYSLCFAAPIVVQLGLLHTARFLGIGDGSKLADASPLAPAVLGGIIGAAAVVVLILLVVVMRRRAARRKLALAAKRASDHRRSLQLPGLEVVLTV